jgi:tetratricopeptide (TPR) repeat protein
VKARDSFEYADSIESVIVKTEGVQKQIELLLEATRVLNPIDPDKALLFADRALILAAASKSQELLLQAMIEAGTIRTFKTHFAQGMELALKAREIALRIKDKKALGKAYLIIGMIRSYQGKFSESYEVHFTALRLFEEAGDHEGMLRALNGIGNVCYYQRDVNKAFIYYSKALAMARELHDTEQIASVLNNVGLVLMERREIIKAIECYREAIDINTHLGMKVRLATNYMNLGILYKLQGNQGECILNYNKAFAILAESGSRHTMAQGYLLLSEYYKDAGDPANQLKSARLAFATGTIDSLRDIKYRAANIIHDYYLKEGLIDSAYKYVMISHAEKDRIESEQSASRLTLLEMEYNYDKEQKEERIKQQRKDYITVIVIILAISALITTILFLSRQIARTKNIRLEKQRLADEIEFKNKEMTINVMNLIKKNELIVDISNRLIHVGSLATDPEMKQEILQLISSLQKSTSIEIWEEFEVRFRQVHNSFYDKLLSAYPDLSANELKLCALLRLNLTTKEICELSGQRPSSLDVARYRLRKKLGLGNSHVNLVNFLSQI